MLMIPILTIGSPVISGANARPNRRIKLAIALNLERSVVGELLATESPGRNGG